MTREGLRERCEMGGCPVLVQWVAVLKRGVAGVPTRPPCVNTARGRASTGERVWRCLRFLARPGRVIRLDKDRLG